MNITDGLLPELLLWLAFVPWLVLLAAALYTAPWRNLSEHAELRHLYLGCTVLALIIWSLKAGIQPGLSFHMLGGTLFTLMFGWQLALIAMSTLVLGITINGAADWSALALNTLLMGALPVLTSGLMLKLGQRWLPSHFFVYILFNGYFCAALMMGLVLAGSTLLMLCCGPYDWHSLSDRFLVFAPMMMFAEGFMTGMLLAALALFKPEWLISFDERRYLEGK